jgi:hypothetical protein
MNKLLKIVVGIIGVFILGIALVFYLTSGMADTANSFFSAIKSGDISKARGFLSEDFKMSTDENALKEFLSTSALLNFKEANWSSRQINGGIGELNGAVTTSLGGVIPLKLIFVKENDTWKIYAIQKPTAGLQQEESSPSIPTLKEQEALVQRAIFDFGTSVNSKDMTIFRNSISAIWQKQVTKEELEDAFSEFYESGGDFTILSSLSPQIERVSELGENGELILKGYFLSGKHKVTFTQKYIYQGIAWKLFGFSIYVDEA